MVIAVWLYMSLKYTEFDFKEKIVLKTRNFKILIL